MKPKIRFRSFFASAGIAALITSEVQAASGTWNVDADGNWTDSANWLDNIIADGSGSNALFTTDLTANRTVTLNGDRTIGNITFTDSTTSSSDLTISGGNILTLAGTTPTVTVTQAGRTLTFSSEIAGTSGLTKTGLGSLTLNGSAVSTLTGGLNVNRGTLTLDYANLATPTNLIHSGNALSLGTGGTLTLTGKDSVTNTAQTFNGTTLGIGRNTISLAKGTSATSATLNLGALTLTPGTVASIVTGTAGSTTWATGVTPTSEIITVSGITGKTLPASPGTANWINVNAGLFYRQNTSAGSARWVSVDNLGQLQGLPVSVGAQGTSGTVTVARQISTADITLVGNAESYGLLNNSNNAARQLSLGGFTYTINGIIVTNTNLATIVPGTGGRLIIGSEKNLVINSDNSGGTAISAPIDNNGSTGGVGGDASGVTVTSTIPSGTPGTVTLSGTNTYTGHTFINNATLTLGNNSALGTTDSGTTLIGSPLGGTAGTTLSLGATALTLSENIHLNGNELGRARILNGAAVDHVINGNIDVTSDTGFAQIWSNAGSITINGDITGTLTNGSLFLLRGNSGSTSNRVLGSLNISGNLSKTEGGQWLIGAPGETYSWGSTSVAFGTLRMGAANVLPSTTVVTFGTNTNTATLNLNGFSQTVAGIQHSSAWNGTALLTVTSATAATLTAGDANNYSYGGVLTGALALAKTGAGSLTLSGANTHTGGTTVSGGTLTINGSLGDTTMSISAGTVNGSGTLTSNIDGATFDAITLTGGTLTATGLTLNINPTGLGLAQAEYVLVDATGGGTISGTFAGLTGAPGYELDYDTPNQVKLVLIPASGFATWISGTFANGTIPEAQRGENQDFDNDGISNLVEYAVAGEDPTVPNSSVGSFNGTTLSFTKRDSTSGLTYAIVESTDLGLADDWTEVTGGTYTNNATTISYAFPGGSPPKNFLRLKVMSN